MDFEKYRLNDFLMDESFYNSVKKPNSDEGKFWESWLNDHPEKRFDANEAKKVIDTISFKDQGFNSEEITSLWKKIKDETINQVSAKSNKPSIRVFPWKLLKVAAVILPFVIASVLFLFYREDTNEGELLTQELIEKLIPKGQKLTVFLSDGSKVILNSESKISYPKPFDVHQRIVELEGEAFFEITPDKNRPFIVKSGNLLTKVLGTSFNIKAYPFDKNVKVAVKTGKVSVENTSRETKNKKSKTVILLPSEMVTYQKSDNTTNISGFDPREELDWRKGILNFNNASMEEFVAKLERWYGVDIIVERSKPIAKGIVGSFNNQSLEEILMGTKETTEFEYEFLSNGKIIIK